MAMRLLLWNWCHGAQAGGVLHYTCAGRTRWKALPKLLGAASGGARQIAATAGLSAHLVIAASCWS